MSPRRARPRARAIVALTGAGCSTESGIPDYRGAGAPPRPRPPMQHREFVDRAEARRRYWARSMLGWPRLAAAQPERRRTTRSPRSSDAARSPASSRRTSTGCTRAAGSRARRRAPRRARPRALPRVRGG